MILETFSLICLEATLQTNEVFYHVTYPQMTLHIVLTFGTLLTSYMTVAVALYRMSLKVIIKDCFGAALITIFLLEA